jgi:hypothetical protein
MLARMFLACLLILLIGSTSSRGENKALSTVPKQLLTGMPDDVAALIERVDGCVHWTGETPFDDERAAQIEKALAELKCGDLQKDIKKLIKRHAGKEPVLMNLGYIAREYLIPSYDPFETERLMRDMPPDVTDLISRADQCVAYQHEQPSDNDRTRVKLEAMKALRCKDLRTDLTWFSEQYAL